MAFAAAVVVVVAYFWSERLTGDITPSSGTGYMLGICGGLMMVATVLYPLRKFWKPMQRLVPVRVWFKAHMALGFVGPGIILVHSNFNFASANATVATVMMLLVVASGVVGRYLHAQIYSGAMEQSQKVAELFADLEVLRAQLEAGLPQAPQIEAELVHHEVQVREASRSLMGGLRVVMHGAAPARSCFDAVRREADQLLAARALRERWTKAQLTHQREAFAEQLRAYFRAVHGAARLQLFERLFRFWHVFHLPLFLLLILTAVGHVVAVHLY